jgi:hypothetical protein
MILMAPPLSTTNRRLVSPGGAPTNTGWVKNVATRVAAM